MATNLENGSSSFWFCDFPEDVQLCVLSFLTPSELSAFACTSKRFASLCRDDSRLWFSMCDRRWGSKTHIRKWGNGSTNYKHLYKTLNEYENLIGFWRRSGSTILPQLSIISPPPLVFFEWGPFYIVGSRVSPLNNGTYQVVKSQFLWMGMTSEGEPVNYLDPDGKLEPSENLMGSGELRFAESDLIRVGLNFIGKIHVVVEEIMCNSFSSSPTNGGFRRVSSSGSMKGEDYEEACGSPGSLPDRLKSEIYQYFANRTSPSGSGSSRRQRRREKERQGRRRKWEPEHFVKIVNCSPMPARPLQGLWKGISDDRNLEFYLVSYDDVGGITCRKIGDLSGPLSGYAPVFWTSDSKFNKPPFSPEEEDIYDSRIHLQPIADGDRLPSFDDRTVLGMLQMNSSYDLVIPDLAGTNVNPRQNEGRIWRYQDGTFGFGFLRNDYVMDLKHIAEDGCLLDTVDSCRDAQEEQC